MINLKNLRISHWDPSGDIHQDDFILNENLHPKIYSTQKALIADALEKHLAWQPLKKMPYKPILQLTPKGISLISYLYSLKDNNDVQPLVASTIDDLKRLVTMIDNAPPGLEVTVIFQATNRFDGFYHKTVGKFIRTADGIRCIIMDATLTQDFIMVFRTSIREALAQNAKSQNRRSTILFLALQKDPVVQKGDKFIDLSRIIDDFQCGIFAIKDARQLNRDTNLATQIFHPSKLERDDFLVRTYLYDIPPEYLKPVQSSLYRDYARKLHGDKVVTRKGKTLAEVFDKHNPLLYTNKFSQKFLDSVTAFLDKYKNNIAFVKACTVKYDAGSITQEDLLSTYMSKNTEEHKKRLEDVIIENSFEYASLDSILNKVIKEGTAQDPKILEAEVLKRWQDAAIPVFMFDRVADFIQTNFKGLTPATSYRLAKDFLEVFSSISHAMSYEERISAAFKQLENDVSIFEQFTLSERENFVQEVISDLTFNMKRHPPKLEAEQLEYLRKIILSALKNQSQVSRESLQTQTTQKSTEVPKAEDQKTGTVQEAENTETTRPKP